MIRLAAFLGVLSLVACGPSLTPEFRSAETHLSEKSPRRIVSLDYCSDQYVLKMVDREHILAVSPDAGKDFSYMKVAAKGLPTVRASAEDIVLLNPDLIVRSHGGGADAPAFFKRAGIPVLNVGWAEDIDGIKRVTRKMAAGLGEVQKGEDIVKDMERRLAALKSREGVSALYMTPGGVTSGPGSLIDEMMTLAGLTNFQKSPGWRSIPLERLAYERPDMIVGAFFDTHHQEGWSSMRHPIARAQMQELPTVALNGSWMSCGGWFGLDAIEAMAEKEL